MSDQQTTQFHGTKYPRLTAALLFLTIFAAVITASASVHPSTAKSSHILSARSLASIRIGVLAHKGTDICREMWQPTMDYLGMALPGLQFDLVPLEFNEVEPAVKNKSIDFLICNPAIYVDLEVRFGVTRTMTLRNLVGTQVVSEFGGVVFCRADRSDLKGLRDARGQRLAATGQTSFGGWYMALREFRSTGIDPERDCARLFFLNSHPAVVRAVLSGEADLGTVRTDTIERMAASGEIRVDAIRVIPANVATGMTSTFPYLHSTRLYPEWPFAKLSDTTEDLSREVTIALLSMPDDSPAAIAAESGGWGVCLDYTSVHDCLRELRLPPYEHYGQLSWPDMWRQYRPWLVAIMALIIALLGAFLLLRGKQLAVMRVSGQNRLLLASAGEGICGIDIDGITTFVNPAANKMLGYTTRELLGKNLHALTHHTKPDGRSYPSHECPIFMACNDGTVHQGSDELFYRKDGSAFPISYSSQPIVDMGRISGAVICFQDISKRKQVEEALRKSEASLNLLLETIPIPVFYKDREGRYLGFNKAFETFFGKSKEQLIGKSVFDVSPPELAKVYHAKDIDLFDKPCVQVYDSQVRDAHGVLHNVIFHKASLTDTQGSATGLIGAVLDITERKRAEEALIRVNEILEQRVTQEVKNNMEQERMLIHQSRMAAMGEMIGNIAHQWRQPLNALGLLLFNIKDEFHFNTLDAVYLDKAVADGSRMVQKMSTTISDFSNFFRPDKEISVFSALAQIRDAIALVESSFQNSHISIHIDVPQDLMLLGFPNEYSQVLLNLLSNAKEAILAHHQPHQLPSGRVDIVLTECDGQGCVSVCDNGGGIPAEILDKIFDPYFSTKVSGTGIGLYMSKMIIERNMNGGITARNIEGGAEFRVCAALAKDSVYNPSGNDHV